MKASKYLSIWRCEATTWRREGSRMSFCALWSSQQVPAFHSNQLWKTLFNDFYRTQVSLVRSMGPVLSLRMRPFADLTDVTLVDEDTNSIPTNNTNRTIQDNVAMPVTNPGDQFENICKWSNGQYWNQCKLPGLLHSFMILLKQTWFFVAPSGGQICN